MSMSAPRLLTAALCCLAAIVLSSCGSAGKGLIPAQNAGPLQGDFEAVAQAAQTGNGSCTATATAVRKTEQDFAALPATVDRGLHSRLESGISNLRSRALTLCTQPIPSTETTTTVSTTTKSTQTSSSSTTTTETSTSSTLPTEGPTATTPSGPGGGTQAPGTEGTATPGAGGANPGTGNGQPSPGAGAGAGEPGAGGAGQ